MYNAIKRPWPNKATRGTGVQQKSGGQYTRHSPKGCPGFGLISEYPWLICACLLKCPGSRAGFPGHGHGKGAFAAAARPPVFAVGRAPRLAPPLYPHGTARQTTTKHAHLRGREFRIFPGHGKHAHLHESRPAGCIHGGGLFRIMGRQLPKSKPRLAVLGPRASS